ncbi:hypothetical protein GCM10027028_65150 [Streptomyces sundarbansensis]
MGRLGELGQHGDGIGFHGILLICLSRRCLTRPVARFTLSARLLPRYASPSQRMQREKGGQRPRVRGTAGSRGLQQHESLGLGTQPCEETAPGRPWRPRTTRWDERAARMTGAPCCRAVKAKQVF